MHTVWGGGTGAHEAVVNMCDCDTADTRTPLVTARTVLGYYGRRENVCSLLWQAPEL